MTNTAAKRKKGEESKLPIVVLDLSPEIEDKPEVLRSTCDTVIESDKTAEDAVLVDEAVPTTPLPKSQKTLLSFLQPQPAVCPVGDVIPDDDSRHIWGWREEKDCS